MGSIHIPALDDASIDALRRRAERHGRSLEEEAQEILRCAAHAPELSLSEAIRRRFAPFGGVDLPEIPREPMRDLPNFE